jgi:hypothetical protein
LAKKNDEDQCRVRGELDIPGGGFNRASGMMVVDGFHGWWSKSGSE